MKTDTQHLARFNDLLLLYKAEIELSTMRPLAKKTYSIHAQNFVRWIAGDFVPGGKLKMKQMEGVDSTD